MSYEFLESHRDIKVGDKIRVSVPPPFDLVDLPFAEHLLVWRRRNRFTIETIQEDGDGEVIVTVREVPGGILGYNQLEKIPASVRMLNWRKQ